MAKNPKRVARPVAARAVAPHAAALAELDRLLSAHERREVDDWQVAPRLREIGEAFGPRFFDELVNRIWGPDEQIRSSVVWALGVLGGGEAVPRLWSVVRTSHRSTQARLGALEALERMGVKVASEEVPEDLLEKIGLAGRRALRTVIAAVQEAQTPADVEAAMLPTLQRPYGTTVEESEKGLKASVDDVSQAVRRADPAAANFLLALVATTPVQDLRVVAERALSLLRSRGVTPTLPAVQALRDQRFFKASIRSVPGQPGLIEVVVAWARGEQAIRAFVFTIDADPLRGGIRAFEATPDLSPTALRRRFVEEAWRAGTPPQEVSLEEARKRVADAQQANLRMRLPFPADFLDYRPSIDRYLLAE